MPGVGSDRPLRRTRTRGPRPASRRADPPGVSGRARGHDGRLRRGATTWRAPGRPSPSCAYARWRPISLTSMRCRDPRAAIRPRPNVRCSTPRRSCPNRRSPLPLDRLCRPRARDPCPGPPHDAAEAVARIETVPAPCDPEWTIKRHAVRAPRRPKRPPERGLDEARAAVAAAEPTGMIVFSANAYRTLADVLRASRDEEASTAPSRPGPRSGQGEHRRGIAIMRDSIAEHAVRGVSRTADGGVVASVHDVPPDRGLSRSAAPFRPTD